MTVKHLNQAELADRWGVSQRTLERWRAIGWGPCFLKMGGRVVYRLEDIEAYEIQHMRASTSEPANQPQMGGAV
ncbi:MAG: helix-turn-helix domain-containing protein [Candidatus Thiodiazotropha endolucinida]